MKKFILNPSRLQGQGLGVIMGHLATAYCISKSLNRKPVLHLDALDNTLFSLQQTQEDHPGYSEQKQNLLDTFPNISKHFHIEKEIPSIAKPDNSSMIKFNNLCDTQQIADFFKTVTPRTDRWRNTKGKNKTLSIDAYSNRYCFEHDLDFLRDELFVFNDKILKKTKPYVEAGGENSIAVSLRLEYHITHKKNKPLPAKLYHTPLSPRYYSLALERFDQAKFPRGATAFVFCDYPNESSNFIDEISFANGTMALMGNKFNASELLCIFSHCKHAVLSNSAFAFWGAALNKNKRAKIICPTNYMSGESDQFNPVNGRWYLPEWEALEQV